MTSNILLVDDEALALQLLKKNLSKSGLQVDTAENGEAGLAALHQQHHVLVTDIVMPKLDGIELISAARQNNAHLVIIAMTSFADKDRAIAALNAGADYLIEKPFTASDLLQLIERLLGQRQAHVQSHLDLTLEKQLTNFALSDPELVLVGMLLRGLAHKQIAHELGLKEQTVKNRMSSLYNKLGISGRSELFQLLFPV